MGHAALAAGRVGRHPVLLASCPHARIQRNRRASSSSESSTFLPFEKMSEVRKLTRFLLAKNDHRWVTSISLKTASRAANETQADQDSLISWWSFAPSLSRSSDISSALVFAKVAIAKISRRYVFSFSLLYSLNALTSSITHFASSAPPVNLLTVPNPRSAAASSCMWVVAV